MSSPKGTTRGQPRKFCQVDALSNGKGRSNNTILARELRFGRRCIVHRRGMGNVAVFDKPVVWTLQPASLPTMPGVESAMRPKDVRHPNSAAVVRSYRACKKIQRLDMHQIKTGNATSQSMRHLPRAAVARRPVYGEVFHRHRGRSPFLYLGKALSVVTRPQRSILVD